MSDRDTAWFFVQDIAEEQGLDPDDVPEWVWEKLAENKRLRARIEDLEDRLEESVDCSCGDISWWDL